MIKCTRCRRSLRGDPESEPDPFAPPAASSTAHGSEFDGSARLPALPTPLPVATAPAPAAPVATPPIDEVWSAPRPHSSTAPSVAGRRAMPTAARRWGPDPWMLLAGLLLAGAGVMAWLAIREPWVHLTVSRDATDFEPALVLEFTMRGQIAFAGTAGTALALALVAFGGIWCFYGLQRGWTMPTITHPALAVIICLVGLAMTALSALVWYVWEDAMVVRSATVDLSMQEMQAILDQQPNPLVEVQRLSGLMTFGGMMVAALCVSCLAWWAYRRRGS